MNDEDQSKTPGSADAAGSGADNASAAQKNGNAWEMPVPTFRVSEGVPVKKSLPEAETVSQPVDENLAKLYAPPESDGDAVTAKPLPPEPPPFVPAVNIMPQPEISGNFHLPELEEGPAVTKKAANPILGLVFTAAGLIAMILFGIVFLGLVYYLFFYKSGSGASF